MARKPGGYLFRQINRNIGKALHGYGMISDGDRILVGLSGGKDSMTLLWSLAERLTRVRIRYELFPVFVDPGFENGFAEPLTRFIGDMGYELRVEMTDFGVLSHSEENRENPCFLCSRLRRKRLFEIADELGCNKVALGHNKDDIIETLFLNMCYAGEISAMLPAQSFFRGEFTMIRPLSFVDEDMIRRFAKKSGFPDFVNPCPSAGKSRRKEVKDMLEKLYGSNPKIKGNLFHSMSNVRPEYLL